MKIVIFLLFECRQSGSDTHFPLRRNIYRKRKRRTLRHSKYSFNGEKLRKFTRGVECRKGLGIFKKHNR